MERINLCILVNLKVTKVLNIFFKKATRCCSHFFLYIYKYIPSYIRIINASVHPASTDCHFSTMDFPDILTRRSHFVHSLSLYRLFYAFFVGRSFLILLPNWFWKTGAVRARHFPTRSELSRQHPYTLITGNEAYLQKNVERRWHFDLSLIANPVWRTNCSDRGLPPKLILTDY